MAISPNRAVLLTKIAIKAIARIGESIHSGGAPIPPGLPMMRESTSPPPKVRPGSSKIRDGCRINSSDHGAQTAMGVAIRTIRRAFFRSKISLVIGLVCELNAMTSKITKMNCQSTIVIKASGENAQTIVNKSASHQVLRQPKFSNCSSPKSARINHGPITINTTVPRRPLLIALSVVGENA